MSDTPTRAEVEDRRKRAGWALETTRMAKSGYAPRKATLAEWVVELADALLAAYDKKGSL